MSSSQTVFSLKHSLLPDLRLNQTMSHEAEVLISTIFTFLHCVRLVCMLRMYACEESEICQPDLCREVEVLPTSHTDYTIASRKMMRSTIA